MNRVLWPAVLAVACATGTSSFAAPLVHSSEITEGTIGVQQARLVCDDYGNCYRTRGPRYIERDYYDDDYGPRGPGFGVYAGPRYYGGPRFGFGVDIGRW